MKQEIVKTLGAMAELLSSCGWTDQAIRLKAAMTRISSKRTSRADVASAVTDLKKVIAGQGSFTDIPLSPLPGCHLSREELRCRQWALAVKLDELLAKHKDDPN